MPLKVNFTIPNNAVILFVALVVLFSLAGVVAYTYKGALTGVPNPGHSLTQIQGYSTGDATLADTIGSKLCQSDGTNCAAASGVTSLSQGNGIILSPNPITSTGTISADTLFVQRRVGSICDSGSSIREIKANGTVVCETDDVGPGDITGVAAGVGLTGGGTSGDVSLALANPTASTIGGVKSRTCGAGEAVIGIDTSGSVLCGSGGGGTGPVNSYIVTATVSVPASYSSYSADLTCNAGYGLSEVVLTSGSSTYEIDMTVSTGTYAQGTVYGTGATGNFRGTCVSGALSYQVNGRAYVPTSYLSATNFLYCLSGYAPTNFTVISNSGTTTHSTSGNRVTITQTGTLSYSNYKATCVKT